MQLKAFGGSVWAANRIRMDRRESKTPNIVLQQFPIFALARQSRRRIKSILGALAPGISRRTEGGGGGGGSGASFGRNAKAMAAVKESPDDLHFFGCYPKGFGDGRRWCGCRAARTSKHLYAMPIRACMCQMTKGTIKRLVSFVERVWLSVVS